MYSFSESFVDQFGTTFTVRTRPEWSTVQLLMTYNDGSEPTSYGFAPDDLRKLADLLSQAAPLAPTLVTDEDAIDALRRKSTPVPGRDGVRVDRDGRTWYSARWLGLSS